MTALDIRHYDHSQAPDIRGVLLDVYAEVWADVLHEPFTSVERYAKGLDGWSSRPGWTCVVGYDDEQPAGYAYGAPLPEGAAWWRGLITDVPPEIIAETGTRTYALSELMVRTPWRKTGVSRALHDALLADRPEERATLLVDTAHPRVRALYESWGWRPLGKLRPRIPDAPLFDAMLLDLHKG